MNLAEEARRASAHPADPARACPCAITIADLAGANAKTVFVACHETTIGSRNTSGKREISLS
jgi:azurin